MYRSATGPAFGPLKGGVGVARPLREGPPRRVRGSRRVMARGWTGNDTGKSRQDR